MSSSAENSGGSTPGDGIKNRVVGTLRIRGIIIVDVTLSPDPEAAASHFPSVGIQRSRLSLRSSSMPESGLTPVCMHCRCVA